MPVCPICESEYPEKIKICEDCGIELVDKVYKGKEKQNTCENCSSPVKKGDKFCKNCGIILKNNEFCEVHPEIKAEAVCLICKKFICDECIDEVSGKMFCPEHCNYSFTENNWAVVFTTNQEWEAELKKDFLAREGITAVINSKKDSSRMLTYGRLSEIWLMVPFEQVIEAENLLKK